MSRPDRVPYGAREIPLLAPLSAAGRCADSRGALPELGPADAGALYAVGHPPLFLVYRWHHSGREGADQGGWSFQAMVDRDQPHLFIGPPAMTNALKPHPARRPLRVGDRVLVRQDAGFHKGARGVVDSVGDPRIWVLRDGASTPVYYFDCELDLELSPTEVKVRAWLASPEGAAAVAAATNVNLATVERVLHDLTAVRA